MRFEKRRNKKGEWWCVVLGDNGEPLWRTSEGYKRERDCDHAIELLREDAHEAPISTRSK